ncbi:hypothetical protein KAS08_03640 [Candidatus Pacearchaeota archaeon]|nr:hypothetical protein [Candidatus Pacearchaeota archaeon]
MVALKTINVNKKFIFSFLTIIASIFFASILLVSAANETLNYTNESLENVSSDVFENLSIENVTETLNETELFNVTEETLQNNLTNQSHVDEVENISQEAEESVLDVSSTVVDESSVSTLQYRAVIGRPVKWIKIVNVSDKKVDVKLPKGAEDISILIDEEITAAVEDIKKYDKIVEKSDRKDIVKKNVLTGNVALDIREGGGILTRFWDWLTSFTITGQVILEEDISENIIVTDDAVIIEVADIVEQEERVAVEYYTEAPVANETSVLNGKRIIVSAPSELNYSDILAYSVVEDMDMKMDEIEFKLYWYADIGGDGQQVGGESEEDEDIDAEVMEMMDGKNKAKGIRVEVDFIPYDFDGDNYADYIEWVVPHLSVQVYDLVEIIAIDAIHLDENGVEISNIFDDVSVTDGVWSEAIYAGESVRVWFESNLTNGRVIDVYVRSNDTLAYFDIYETETGQHVGKSGISNREDLLYIIVDNLTEPTSVFDFKIRKVHYDDPDNSSSADPDVNSFLEFDYIHDDYITFTQADGFIAYEELNVQTPRYRTWNESNVFSAELVDANSVGANIIWTVTKASHERDEVIVGMLDNANDVNVQIYDGSWGNLLEVSTGVPNSAYRAFDIEYEGISGNALIVYESSSVADSNLAYRLWNGTGYSSEQILTTPFSNTVHWVSLVSKTGTNDIMLLAHDSLSSLYVIPWNGTAFDSTKDVLFTGMISNIKEHFTFAWEELSNDGIVSYGSLSNWAYRTYTHSTGSWGAENTVDVGDGGIGAVRMCSDKNSDYIGIIWIDSGSDVQARMWDGSTILAGEPVEDASVELNGANNANVDCTWNNEGTRALFGFVDRNALSMDYFNFTKPNVWSTADLTFTSITTVFGSDDIKSLRFSQHPTTDEIMVVAMDLLEDVSLIRWDGSSFQTIATSPIEGTTTVLNGKQENAMFDWYRYDPTPLVEDLVLVDGEMYNISDTVNVTVNITDNIELDSVFANVTYPNGTTIGYGMTNVTSVYNLIFTDTIMYGNYVIRIVVNDTSLYQNVNSSEVVSFVIAEYTSPNVTSVVPVLNSDFGIGETIEIAADVIDDNLIDDVLANITYPNSTVIQLILTNAVGDKYNNSFTSPALLGSYDIVIIANDTSGNLNDTEVSNFSVSDILNPVVIGVLPIEDDAYNVTDNIEISANVTDDLGVDFVLANITYPNSTVVQLTLSNSIDNKYNNSFVAPALSGSYEVKIIANDSSGNVNSSEINNFSVEDVALTLTNLGCVPSNLNLSQSVVCNVTVVDDIGISLVLANVTYPNGTVVLMGVNNIDSNYYFTFSNTVMTGQYNVSWFANDTGENIKTSESNFNVNDVMNPDVTSINPTANSDYNISDIIEISTDVTDDLEVDFVLANITYPNSTVIQLTLTNSVGDKYNNSFIAPALLGSYDIVIIANDTSGNLNSTEISNFNVNDIMNPDVTSVFPTANSDYNISDIIEISTDVTDDLEVDFVLANITYPNSTVIQLTLTNSVGDKYNNSFIAPALLGSYDVVIIANDTSGNLNSTEVSNFNVNDIMNPDVEILTPTIGSNFLQLANISLTVNVSDEINVSYVYANFTLPNLTVVRLQLTDSNFDGIYNVTFSNVNETGIYQIEIFANDTSDNLNDSEVRSFSIQESNSPLVNLISPVNNANLKLNDITFTCNSTDDTGLSSISFYHNIGQPFGINETQNVSGVSNESNFIINNIVDGNYIWNCLVEDISSNEIFAVSNFTFNVDTVNPDVAALFPIQNEIYNVSNTIEVAADVTDSNLISTVLANITYPNSTVIQLTLTNTVGNKYNNSFVAPALPGSYEIKIIARDSSGNINDSEVNNFSVEDIVSPVLLNLGCSPENLNLSQSVVCNVTVVDDIGIGTVLADVTYSNGTSVTVAVSNVTDNYYFSFSETSLTGQYNVSWFANDTSGNSETNESLFNVNDVVNPDVTSISPIANSDYNISDIIEISTDVIDDFNVNVVLANITYPNSTVIQLTLTNTVGDKYNNSFIAPALPGSYDVVIIANDTSGNLNSTEVNNFNVNDVVNPDVTSISPIANSDYNISDIIEISTDVIDDFNVNIVLANITYPNSTVIQLTLTNTVGDKYNNSFIAPALPGSYDVVIIANDTSGNLNSTEVNNFNVNDIALPVLLNLGCSPENSNLSQGVICNVSVSDDIGISTVLANITYPNGTAVLAGVNNITDNYYFTFSDTVMTGQYDVGWFANDTSGNSETNESLFGVGDVINPDVTLILPINNFNLSNVMNSSIYLNFTVIDNYDSTLDCSVLINSLLNQTNSMVVNNVPTVFDVGEFPHGTYNWTINCLDASGNSDLSETRVFTIDNIAPDFISLATDPNSIDGLDPGVNITVNANVTEDDTSLEAVIFQYKLTNTTDYTNISMVFNDSSGFYVSILNTTVPGIYNLRLFANDSVGNSDFSGVINRTIEFDHTWITEPPVSFDPISVSLLEDITFEDFVINNAGDFALDFDITSDSNETIYNESENFNLSPGAVKVLSINDTATQAGVKVVTLNISSSTLDAEPSSKIITGSIVVAPNQPVLVNRFLNPSTGSLVVIQGATGVQFNAELENIGEGDAYDTMFFYDLPEDWVVTFGSESITFEGEFFPEDSSENNIEVTIPTDTPVGDYVVTVSTTAINASGANLTELGLIFADTVTVSVQASSKYSDSGGGDTPSPPSTSTEVSSGKKVESDSETIYTTEKLSLVRGTTEFLPITITNFYENAVFENLDLEMQGFLTQYVKISFDFDPEKLVYVESRNLRLSGQGGSLPFNLTELGGHSVLLSELRGDSAYFIISSNPINMSLDLKESKNIDLDGDGVNDSAITLWDITNGIAQIWIHKLGPAEEARLYFLESRNYTFEIFAPPYLEKQDYEITLEISADIVALDSEAAGFMSKPFLEYRTLIFGLIEKSSDEAIKGLDDAKKSLLLMRDAGFPVGSIEDLLRQATSAFGNLNYELTLEFTDRILALAKTAFEADLLIKEIQGEVEKAKLRWLDVSETENNLILAIKAFEREDFEAAMDRAKDAQLALILETKGKFDLLWVIVNYWWLIIISMIILLIVLFLSYKHSTIFIINQRLKGLDKEEKSINTLMEESQTSYLSKGSFSPERYKQAIVQYENRLDDLKHLRIKLRNKRIGILRTDQEIKNLVKEKRELNEMMVKTQEDYFNKEKLTERKFKRLYNLEKERLSELDEEKIILEEKHRKEKNTKKYKLLKFLNDMSDKVKIFLERTMRK